MQTQSCLACRRPTSGLSSFVQIANLIQCSASGRFHAHCNQCIRISGFKYQLTQDRNREFTKFLKYVHGAAAQARDDMEPLLLHTYMLYRASVQPSVVMAKVLDGLMALGIDLGTTLRFVNSHFSGIPG